MTIKQGFPPTLGPRGCHNGRGGFFIPTTAHINSRHLKVVRLLLSRLRCPPFCSSITQGRQHVISYDDTHTTIWTPRVDIASNIYLTHHIAHDDTCDIMTHMNDVTTYTDDDKLSMWSVRFVRMCHEPMYVNVDTRTQAINAIHRWCDNNNIDPRDIDYIDPPLRPQPRHGEVYTKWLKRESRRRGDRSRHA